MITINGLTASDLVTIFDISGRQLKTGNSNVLTVNPGVYMVKINNYISKVVVR